MKEIFVFLLAALLIDASCPPPNVKPMLNVNFTAYLGHPWHVQQMQPVVYQQPASFFCTRDTYSMDTNASIFLKTDWNEAAVDGKPKQATLHGLIEDMDNPSHLLVGFKWMPKVVRGPYWILDAGPSPDNYEYLLVSGGPPQHKSADGTCRPGTLFNYSGLWLMTKERVPNLVHVKYMRMFLKNLGYDMSILKDVIQVGCVDA